MTPDEKRTEIGNRVLDILLADGNSLDDVMSVLEALIESFAFVAYCRVRKGKRK
jgi:hypothetical protein